MVRQSVLALVLLAMPAHAETIAGPFEARYVSCYDADTCRFDVSIWVDLSVHTAVRMRGVDAPEIAGTCLVEKLLAATAREFMRALLERATTVQIASARAPCFAARV